MPVRTLTAAELQAIVDEHAKYLRGDGGQRADLRYADLRYADLRYADLSYANLRYADLSYADLSYADLSYANLRSANLRSANLRSANLRSANLSSADLRSANLSSADLSWQSHDLIAQVLVSAAGKDIEKRKVAGLILVSPDWCWPQFLAMEEPLRDWALGVLAGFVRNEDGVPAEVLAARAKAGTE